jgi:MFS superfamily sulfate permease-like transporter
MWTFKNLVALGLFLFGTTFLWMTPAFAGKTPPPTGTAWTLANVLALVAVAGFTVAAWAVFKQSSWWQTAALLSGMVGLVAVVPFVVGQGQLDVGLGDPGVQINLWLHLLGSAAVIAIVLLPAAHDWVTQRL